MESSSTSTRFRFRDHSELMEDSTQLGTDSDVSSVSSDLDDDAEPESMTGKVIFLFSYKIIHFLLQRREKKKEKKDTR